MLFLLFDLGIDRYAIDVRQVKEVLPLLELRVLPQAPTGVAGLCNYRGLPVPVLDLCLMVTGKRARERLSTRIIMVHYEGRAGERHILGLIAEHATETLRRDGSEFVEAGVRQDETPYLGPVTQLRDQLVQWVKIENLLTPEVQQRLFTMAAES
ncbi:chemotaxis protein CheW [Allohahella sp. A8]|uniref:chemotaxis protein CheW n=1 Tax=Allohahella sp. A8 TaxID=3141461 RepID=UPI003A7F7446